MSIHLNNQGIVNLPKYLEHIEGEIVKIVFVSDDESYAVAKIKCNNEELINVTGPIGGAFEGQLISADGKWEKHKEYGKQFVIDSVSFKMPQTTVGIEKYLASGIVYGIGPKRANLIVSHFKERTLDILDNYSARLTEIPGLGKKTLEEIRKSWKEQENKREVSIFFQGLGITPAYCNKIYKQFGKESLKIVKTDPYKLADIIKGIGFTKADIIAKNLGILHNDPKRVLAGIKYTLNQLSDSGHTCYPIESFIKIASDTLEISEEETKQNIELAVQNSEIISEKVILNGTFEQVLYDKQLHSIELTLSKIIFSILRVNAHKCMHLKSIKIVNDGKIILNSEQLNAVENVSNSPISIITGGPGTGKTTIVSEIMKKAKAAKLRICLIAPTGRAAKRLAETTGHYAQPIHRLLRWNHETRSFSYGFNNKLPYDLIIVDECSMLDIPLANSLFAAIKLGTTVVLVGDADQLPSVGPGKFLNDIISSEKCLVTRLKSIYRQSSRGRIISIAHSINEGIFPDIQSEETNKLSDFYFIELEDQERIAENIAKLVSERIPKRFGLNPVRDIQVLSPMSRGICGTISLNNILQQNLNFTDQISFTFGQRVFKKGDKVMQVTNNYDKNVFNGDIGFIININRESREFLVSFDSERVIKYDFEESAELLIAYAITIHKSQGSEFPAVILPCVMSHYIMLQRNLIYTAVTRAKKLLIILGTKKALKLAISNFKTEPRYSGLLSRLTHYQ